MDVLSAEIFVLYCLATSYNLYIIFITCYCSLINHKMYSDQIVSEVKWSEEKNILLMTILGTIFYACHLSHIIKT